MVVDGSYLMPRQRPRRCGATSFLPTVRLEHLRGMREERGAERAMQTGGEAA